MSGSVRGSPASRGEAAHRLVQCGLARPVDLDAALVLVGDTSLPEDITLAGEGARHRTEVARHMGVETRSLSRY
jgi:hypothetical protein